MGSHFTPEKLRHEKIGSGAKTAILRGVAEIVGKEPAPAFR